MSSSSAADKINSSDECRQKENTAFFLWRGRHSSVSGRDTAAFLSIGMNIQEESQVSEWITCTPATYCKSPAYIGGTSTDLLIPFTVIQSTVCCEMHRYCLHRLCKRNKIKNSVFIISDELNTFLSYSSCYMYILSFPPSGLSFLTAFVFVVLFL